MENTANQFIRIACGVGTKPITIAWQENLTAAQVLSDADITIPKGYTATLGRRCIQDPATEIVQPYDFIIIAGKPGNG